MISLSEHNRMAMDAYVTAAWSRYADAVIAFNVAPTAANAEAKARSYRAFVDLFVGPERSSSNIINLDAVRLGDVP